MQRARMPVPDRLLSRGSLVNRVQRKRDLNQFFSCSGGHRHLQNLSLEQMGLFSCGLRTSGGSGGREEVCAFRPANPRKPLRANAKNAYSTDENTISSKTTEVSLMNHTAAPRSSEST